MTTMQLDEYRQDSPRAKSQLASEARRLQSRLQMMKQAELKAEAVTGDPNWDTFLSYIQEAVEETEGQAKGFLAVLSDPTVVNQDRMMQMKIGLRECQARIDAFNAVMSLPKDLIKLGKDATALLKRMLEIAE